MEKSKIASRFYLDKEKDIVVNLIEEKEDELTYILETPNHNTGNLITNLARICGLKTIKNEKDMKIIKGTIPASINGDNEEVYIFRMGGIKVANIYKDGRVAIKATIPAISKTLMSQTKNYNFSINETLVKSYILKKAKFRTDLHTHMNAMLPSDCLIALGLVHQVRYPLYYIKKLRLTLSKKQEKEIYKQREEVEKLFVDSDLKGKYLTRKIDDNTFINFADFILNNLENATENLKKISKSLEILKDGQAVFTNLEKLYIYRYVFAKGTESKEKIELNSDLIKQIPDKDIKSITLKMLEDKQKESPYCKNNLRQDKLLWIAREYQRQGIYYVEIADTVLTKKGIPAIELLEELEEVLIMSDVGVETSLKIIDNLRTRIKREKIEDEEGVKKALREEIKKIFDDVQENNEEKSKPSVILVVGVNGVGKTTSIGKIANRLRQDGKKVVIAAADTFRAAAVEQLEIWADRANCDIVKRKEGSDPASVVYDAIKVAKEKNADILICDTAGRLHNKKYLMDELEKIKKVIDKELPDSSKEVLMVLDATTGQNAISQVKAFKETVDINGIILTKLDGTAKGGAIIGIVSENNIPVKFIGVGEQIDDMEKFNSEDFVKALI